MHQSLTRTSLSEAILMCQVGHTQCRWEHCSAQLWCVLLYNSAQFTDGCVIFLYNMWGELYEKVGFREAGELGEESLTLSSNRKC